MLRGWTRRQVCRVAFEMQSESSVDSVECWTTAKREARCTREREEENVERIQAMPGRQFQVKQLKRATLRAALQLLLPLLPLLRVYRPRQLWRTVSALDL